jgi:hypothetical protein
MRVHLPCGMQHGPPSETTCTQAGSEVIISIRVESLTVTRVLASVLRVDSTILVERNF